MSPDGERFVFPRQVSGDHRRGLSLLDDDDDAIMNALADGTDCWPGIYYYDGGAMMISALCYVVRACVTIVTKGVLAVLHVHQMLRCISDVFISMSTPSNELHTSLP